MKNTIVLTAALVMFLSGSTFSQAALEILDSDFDFGKVPQKSTITHYFWFKSVGTDTLRIRKIKTGCSCATMPMERDWIAPGDSLLVGILWDTERRSGNMGRYPYIFTNAREDAYRLSLVGSAQTRLDGKSSPVAISPYKWELSRIAQKSIDSVAFTIHNNQENDMTLEVLSFPVNECEIVLPDTLKAGSDNYGYVKVRDGFSDSEFKRSITFRLSDEKHTIYTVPIRRKVY